MSISHKKPILPCFSLCLWEVEWLLRWYIWDWLAGMLCSVLPIFSQVLAACGGVHFSAQRWRLCLLWFSGNGSLFSHTKLYFPMLHYPTIRIIVRLPWSLAFITPFIQNPRKEEDHSLLGISLKTPIALVNLVFTVCIFTWYLHILLVIGTCSCLPLFC